MAPYRTQGGDGAEAHLNESRFCGRLNRRGGTLQHNTTTIIMLIT